MPQSVNNSEQPAPAEGLWYKPAADALGVRFNELNGLWQTVESELKKIPLPVNASVVMWTDANSDGAPSYDARLGFVKASGGWRLCVGFYCYYDDEESWTPVTECTLDLRLKAVAHVHRLKSAVLEAAEKSIGKLDSAILELSQAIAK